MEKQYILIVIAAAVLAALSMGCGSEGEKQNAEQGLSTQTLIMQDETVVLPAVPYESTETTDSRDSVTNGSYVTMYKLPDEDACRIEEMGGTEANKSYRIFYDETVADDGHRYGYFGITYAVNTYGADDESMRYGIISQHEEHWDEDNYVYPKQECTSEMVDGMEATYFYFSQYYAMDTSYESLEHECIGFVRIADGNYLKITVHIIDKQYQFNYEKAVSIFRNAVEGIISFTPVQE